MLRLLKIEWFKLKNYRTFTVLSVIYYFFFLLLLCSVKMVLAWMTNQGWEFEGITPEIIPFYDFPDVWQNLTYLAKFVKYLLAFIVIISVTNEYSYRTIRQNVIDGMSPKNFLISKELMIIAFSIVNVLIIWLAGTIMGIANAKVFETELYFSGMEFLLAHFIELFTFLNLAFLLSVLMKKAGFAIIIICIYGFIAEPIAVGLTTWLTNDSWVVGLFPMNALSNLVPFPFSRYILMEIQNTIDLTSVFIVLGWLAISISIIYYRLVKKDIN